MKYVVVQGDGMADGPHPNLDGKTPLQAAAMPHMAGLAAKGEVGTATLATDGLAAGTYVEPLALFGYDLRKYHCGAAPFEAASLDVALGDLDVAFRCHFVTFRADVKGKGAADEVKKLGPQAILDDATAGGVTNEEARELIDAINEQLGSETMQFYAGSAHRHLMVWIGGKAKSLCRDPREAVGKPVGDFLPSGDGADMLRKVMDSALIVLRDHPVNEQRREAGLKPVNGLWLWGQGKMPKLPKLTDQFQVSGSIVSNRELLRGIGVMAGLDMAGLIAKEAGAEPDCQGLAETALRELAKKDLVYVHVKMPSKVARGADGKAKVHLLEEFDRKTMGTLLDGLRGLSPYRLLVVCDHAEGGAQPHAFPGPYLLYDSAKASAKGGAFHEAAAAGAMRDASRLMARLLNKP